MKSASRNSKKFRKETDSLGTIEIPEDALWGSHTARSLQNFQVSGRTIDPALIQAYLRIKAASAISNAEVGNLSVIQRDLILAAIDELLKFSKSEWRNIFPVDIFQAGAGTSLNMNVNEVIANVANRLVGEPLGRYTPIHPNDHVNRAQSTNDTFPTALRLALLELSRELTSALDGLAKAFKLKGEEWRSIPKAARTHLQDAVPMRLGDEFSAYGSSLSRCAGWIRASREDLRELGLGGSAAGTGLNVPPGFREIVITELEKLTQERLFSSADLFEAMQSQAIIGFHSSCLRVTALELTRICNDLRLLASGPFTGLAEILLPAVQPGSSIMPGKVNPSIPEMMNQVCFAVLGHDQAVGFATQAGQLELNVMMPLMAASLLEAERIATRATTLLRERCIEGMQPNQKRLQHYLESTPQIATALAPRLGYKATAEVVQEALGSGKSVLQVVRERNLIADNELQNLLGTSAAD